MAFASQSGGFLVAPLLSLGIVQHLGKGHGRFVDGHHPYKQHRAELAGFGEEIGEGLLKVIEIGVVAA